jgi:drug/metabolite transporter (DMT)-like permease
VLAGLFAWFLHDQELAPVQIAGALMIVSAVLWVQSRRPDLEAEMAPPALRTAR